MTSWCWGQVAAALLAGLVAAGCVGRAEPPAATPTATPAAVAATDTHSVPASTATDPEGSTAEPPSESPQPEPTVQPPPAATLVAASSRHPGEPGSWAWVGGTNDAPWLPAAALDRAEVPVGTVHVELAGDIGVETWSARAAAADDTRGENPTPLGDGAGPPSFDLAAGEWVVAVDVQFADGLGGAAYYWYVTVD